MLLPEIQTRRWSNTRLEIRAWLTRGRLVTESEIDDILLHEFFPAVDVPIHVPRHFLITVVEVEPEDITAFPR